MYNLNFYFKPILVLGAPKFKTIDCSKVKGITAPKGYDLCLEVDYEDKQDDVMLLKKVKKEDTVFEGHLLKEGNRVAVTIQDASDMDDIEVISS